MSIPRPETQILRGGLCRLEALRDSAEDCFAVKGYWGVSGWAADDMTVAELVSSLGAKLPHSKMRMVATKDLLNAGFRVEYTGIEHHVTIYFDQKPTDTDLQRLGNLFSSPVLARPQEGASYD